MYITNTTNNVINLCNLIENIEDYEKLELLIYLFNEINCNLINDKNITNVDLIEEDDINVFNLSVIGYENDFGIAISSYLVALYNKFSKNETLYMNNGFVKGIDYSIKNKEIILAFEKLSFKEKLDIISEIIIKWDNNTYFKKQFDFLNIDNDRSGFDIAKAIQDYKNNIKNN